MFRPELLAIFREISLACAAYVLSFMIQIPHMIGILGMVVRCYSS